MEDVTFVHTIYCYQVERVRDWKGRSEGLALYRPAPLKANDSHAPYVKLDARRENKFSVTKAD